MCGVDVCAVCVVRKKRERGYALGRELLLQTLRVMEEDQNFLNQKKI